ncbi:MAG: glycosyltransferase [Leptospirales bacterium]
MNPGKNDFHESQGNIEGKKVQDFSLVIPAYNEEKRISRILGGVTKNMPELKNVIVVVDGDDLTDEVAKSFGSKIKIQKYGSKLGRGGAILAGINSADSEVVCFVDADGAAPWFELAKVAAVVDENNQCVVGSRWVEGSRIQNHEPLMKTIAGRIWHYMIVMVLGLRTKDVQCGLKCFYGPLAKDVVRKVTAKNSLFDVGILYNISKMGYSIKEVGIEWTHVEGTKMSLTKNHILLMFLGLVGLRFSHSRFFETHKKRLNGRAKLIQDFINQFH